MSVNLAFCGTDVPIVKPLSATVYPSAPHVTTCPAVVPLGNPLTWASFVTLSKPKDSFVTESIASFTAVPDCGLLDLGS